MKKYKKYIILLLFVVLIFMQTTVVAKNIFKQGNVLTEVSFPKDEGVILLPVTLLGEIYYFILDTSWYRGKHSYNVYDSSFAPFLGPALIVKTNINGTTTPFYESPDAKLGDLSLKTKDPVLMADLSVLSYFVGQRIHGIIGMSFLKKYALKIDFDKSKVVFYKHLKNITDKKMIASPLTFYHDLPLIECSISGIKSRFVIATKISGNGSLNKKLTDYLVQKNKIKILDKGIGLLNFFSYGSFGHAQVDFSLGKLACVGIGLLSRYSIIFDFPNKKLYLKKRKTFRKDIICRVGLGLIWKDGKKIVFVTRRGSPAAKAGIKKGDIILAVDDKDSNKFTLFMLRRYLKKPGQVLQLKIRRKGKIMKLQLKPEAY